MKTVLLNHQLLLAGQHKNHLQFFIFLDFTVNEDPGQQCAWKQPGRPSSPAQLPQGSSSSLPSAGGPVCPPTRGGDANPAEGTRQVPRET